MNKNDRPWRAGTVFLLASLALPACSPSALAPPDPPIQGSPPAKPAYSQALRVVVKFRQVVPFRDPAFLKEMAQQSHAHIVYISSVASDTHVYQIEPEPGQSRADVLRRLANLPFVLRVEVDAMARPS